MAVKPKVVFWKPGIVVRGKQVYLDANFLVALAQPGHVWHNSAGAVLASLSGRGTGLVLSSLALNEAIYQLSKLEQKSRAWQSEGGDLSPEFSASKEPGWASQLNLSLENLSNLVFFEPPDLTFHQQVIRAVRELSLDPTDAFHYSTAKRLACPILTNDVGFQKIPDQNLVVVTFF